VKNALAGALCYPLSSPYCTKINGIFGAARSPARIAPRIAPRKGFCLGVGAPGALAVDGMRRYKRRNFPQPLNQGRHYGD
jgi:hypothetical protein